MKRLRKFVESQRESGAALLIAIFALLLISVVAIALIVSSGTDTALARNYRTSTNAYYAALAGVEEARGRLLPTNPNFIPLPGAPMPLTQVIYIINPLGGETVAPDNTGNPATYPDTEYAQEFGVDVSTRVVTKYASVSPVAGLPGPAYKWVRINPVTEQSLGDPGGPAPVGVDINSDGTVDQFTPLFYDPENRNGFGVAAPGLIENATPPSDRWASPGNHCLRRPSQRRPPDAPVRCSPPGDFPQPQPAAISRRVNHGGKQCHLHGAATRQPSSSQLGSQGPGGARLSTLLLPAVGYTNNNPADSSFTNIQNGGGASLPLPITPVSHLNPAPRRSAVHRAAPGVGYVGNRMDPNWLDPKTLDAIVQDITNNADVVIPGPVDLQQPALRDVAHASMTVVVNGSLDLNGWHNTGYGLLVVTGRLALRSRRQLEGVILVVGQGNFISTKGGTWRNFWRRAYRQDARRFRQRAFEPRRRFLQPDRSGAPSSNLGSGIYFNSCLAQAAEGPITYKVISFKEIPTN